MGEMKLPDRIKVGLYTLTISRDNRLLGDDTAGSCRLSNAEVVVKTGMAPQETVLTFLHEIAHVYECLWEGDVDERRAVRLSGFLYELLRDNPWLPEVVQKAEKLTEDAQAEDAG